MKQNIKCRPFLSLAFQLQYSPFNQALSPPFIILPLSSPSLPFCHGIASPHFLLTFFEFGPVEFGESELRITTNVVRVQERD